MCNITFYIVPTIKQKNDKWDSFELCASPVNYFDSQLKENEVNSEYKHHIKVEGKETAPDY